MYPIPQDDETRQRMIAEVERSVEDMRGVAGFSVVRTDEPGSVNGVHGGIQEHLDLERVLMRMRLQPLGAHGGKLVIVCTKPDREWKLARMSDVRGVPPQIIDDIVFDDEQSAQAVVFRMRLDQYPETDGMPEDYDPSWKSRGENWAV